MNVETEAHSPRARVVVAQRGCREHYGYARAFQKQGMLWAMLTDLWWSSRVGILAAA